MEEDDLLLGLRGELHFNTCFLFDYVHCVGQDDIEIDTPGMSYRFHSLSENRFQHWLYSRRF